MIQRTRKKWNRLEWLLLLVPLLVVFGLAVFNFAPQFQHAWREWRDYGNNRPYMILRLQTTGKKPLEPSFGTFAFSPDSQQLAVSETLSYGSDFGSPTRVWLWRLRDEKPFRSWLVSEPNNSASKVTQLQYADTRTLSASILCSTLYGRKFRESYITEKRDARSGHLISRKRLQAFPEANSPAELGLLIPSGSPIKFHQRRKNGISIKVSFLQTERRRPQDYRDPGKKYVKVHFFADVSDEKKRSNYRFSLADFDDLALGQGDSSKNVGIAFSPDLRLLFLYVGDDAYEPGSEEFMSRRYIEVFDTQSRKSLWRQNYSGDYRRYPEAVAFSSRGLIAICRDSMETELRDTQSGALLRTIEKGRYYSTRLGNMQFSPDGKLLAMPRYSRLELWDVSDLK